MNSNIGICICARTDSSRLPNKVLKRINNKFALQILLEHVVIGSRWPVVLAIPEARKDDRILTKLTDVYPNGFPFEVHRGQDNSPLHRLYEVAKTNNWDYVVRVTADDIFIDKTLLNSQINCAVNNNYDYVYVSRCLEGIAAEVIKTDALGKVVEKVGEKPIEFVSYLLKTDEFKIFKMHPNFELQKNYRLTLDYPEDLELIRIVDSSLAKGYGPYTIIDFLKRNKHLLNINKLPRVTVYITNYNYSNYVIAAIKSVLDQTFWDYELHIWDDCSDDNSLKKIMQFISILRYDLQKKTKVFVNENNIGLPSTCNKAIKEARGRYILRLDADDVLLPDALECMTREIDRDDNLHAVFSSYNRIDGSGKVIEENIYNSERHPAGCLLNKTVLNELKYRDGLEHFEGMELMKRFDELYNHKIISNVLWNYRKHDNQKSDHKNGCVREKIKAELK